MNISIPAIKIQVTARDGGRSVHYTHQSRLQKLKEKYGEHLLIINDQERLTLTINRKRLWQFQELYGAQVTIIR